MLVFIGLEFSDKVVSLSNCGLVGNEFKINS